MRLVVCLLAVLTADVAFAFACDQAKSETEKTICADDQLIAFDKSLNTLYSAVTSLRSESGTSRLRLEQKSWLKQRDGCKADAKCLALSYENRTRLLTDSYCELRSVKLKSDSNLTAQLCGVPVEHFLNATCNYKISSRVNSGWSQVGLINSFSEFMPWSVSNDRKYASLGFGDRHGNHSDMLFFLDGESLRSVEIKRTANHIYRKGGELRLDEQSLDLILNGKLELSIRPEFGEENCPSTLGDVERLVKSLCRPEDHQEFLARVSVEAKTENKTECEKSIEKHFDQKPLPVRWTTVAKTVFSEKLTCIGDGNFGFAPASGAELPNFIGWSVRGNRLEALLATDPSAKKADFVLNVSSKKLRKANGNESMLGLKETDPAITLTDISCVEFPTKFE